MDTNAIVEVLNDLIRINNDRIEGYKRAIDEADVADVDLKSMFASFISHSEKHKRELSVAIAPYFEQPEEGTTTSGKLYRMWMDMKATFSGDTRQTVLESCEFGEDAAMRTYNEAIGKFELLPVNIIEVISTQKAEIKRDHDRIKELRDLARATG